MKKYFLPAAIIFIPISLMVACNSTNHLTKKTKTMFTAEQIKTAHSKVKSGADFPAYIREIKTLGVTGYETYVTDGHTDCHGAGNYTVTLPVKYEPLVIAGIPKVEAFKAALLAHQQGETSFLVFIKMCASFGVEKWQVCLNKMTCTYYNKSGKEMLVEQIPW